MSLRTLFILAAVTMTLLLVEPVNAAPAAQTDVPDVEEVVVESTSEFTLTVMIDEVTTVAIPLQVDWRAVGPNEGNDDEMSVAISPRVLRTGFFSVTVASVEPSVGSLVITFAAPVEEIEPITRTGTTTTTTPTIPGTAVTTTQPSTATAPVDVPATTGATANAVSNLRAGPSTDFPIVGSANAGDALDIVGQNSDGTWLVLRNGAWIAAFLVNNPPVDLPVVEAPAAPLPTPAASTVLTPTEQTPTVIPTVTPTP